MKRQMLQVLVSLNVYRNKEGVFGGPLQLQIMELRKRGFRFGVKANTARERKEATLWRCLRGLVA